MSYKDDEELNGSVDINEDDADVLLSPEDLDEPIDDDLLLDDELIPEEDDDELEEFAGLDGSEY